VHTGFWWRSLAQDRDRRLGLVNAVMNIRDPQNAGNYLISRRPISFSIRTKAHGVIYIFT
jgi:hypothetical protein